MIKSLLSMSLMALAFQAQAMPVGGADLAGGCALTDLTTSTVCVGVYDPGSDHGVNDIFIDPTFIAVFGSGWTSLDYVEGPWGPTSELGLEVFGGGTTSGRWEVNATAWDGYMQGDILAILKASNMAAAYEIDLEFTSGDWDVTDNGMADFGWGGHDLSHFSFWEKEGSGVPEPAMISLLGIGLLGIAAVRRRKMKV